jgi:hypothetical protein
MSHYAKVLNNKVINSIAAEAEFFDTFVDTSPGQWLQTSYNSRANTHYLPNSDTPSGQPALRANFASVGDNYDPINDVFYAPQPYTHWVLNTTKWIWEPPIPYPTGGDPYQWDDSANTWALVVSALPSVNT